jgi:hypothetical protein
MGAMSRRRCKRARGPRDRHAPARTVPDPRTRSRLWPVAVHWYVGQERLALYRGVRVHQAPGGAAYVWLPDVGDVRLGTDRLPSGLTDPASEVAAAVLAGDGGWELLLGAGATPAGAVDELLGALEQAFVDEVGTGRAGAISASVLSDHPELADERVARGALATLVIEGRGA